MRKQIRIKKIFHYLFSCPTFWHYSRWYKCPDCGCRFPCYWDGSDCLCGKIHLCMRCNSAHEECKVYKMDITAELQKAKFVISKFERWYSDTGCPRSETKESFCPCREELKAEYDKEMAGLAEDERVEFDLEESCEHSTSEGYCYARYYEKLFDGQQALKASAANERGPE